MMTGLYIPPSKTSNSTINYIKLATQHKQNHELVLLGDLNDSSNYKGTHNIQQDATVAQISSLGDNNKWTWQQYQTNRYVTSECDYILTTNIKHFKNITTKTRIFIQQQPLPSFSINALEYQRAQKVHDSTNNIPKVQLNKQRNHIRQDFSRNIQGTTTTTTTTQEPSQGDGLDAKRDMQSLSMEGNCP
jgi:hypothetical protein